MKNYFVNVEVSFTMVLLYFFFTLKINFLTLNFYKESVNKSKGNLVFLSFFLRFWIKKQMIRNPLAIPVKNLLQSDQLRFLA